MCEIIVLAEYREAKRRLSGGGEPCLYDRLLERPFAELPFGTNFRILRRIGGGSTTYMKVGDQQAWQWRSFNRYSSSWDTNAPVRFAGDMLVELLEDPAF